MTAPADADAVDALRASIGRLAALDGLRGSAAVVPVALRNFRRAQGMLRTGRCRARRDLMAVAAELGELSAWLLFDAERHREARGVTVEALALARAAGDAGMESFILTNQALASTHVGRPREALRIVGALTDRRAPTHRLRALLEMRAARALAALGDASGATGAIDRARSRFLDGVGSDDPAWAWWFDERELAGHAGGVCIALGDHDRGLPLLAEAVERSAGRARFRWAEYVHRAGLLRALLLAGSWADAERVAVETVPMVGAVASARADNTLRRAAVGFRRTTPTGLRDALDHLAGLLGPAARG